jgi:hypothetical protein
MPEVLSLTFLFRCLPILLQQHLLPICHRAFDPHGFIKGTLAIQEDSSDIRHRVLDLDFETWKKDRVSLSDIFSKEISRTQEIAKT